MRHLVRFSSANSTCLCKGLSIDDVGVSRDTMFHEIPPGAGFETGDFVKDKLGGLPWNDPTGIGRVNG